MVIPFVVPEILGGVEPHPPHPQMPLSCQERQMPLTVKPQEVKSKLDYIVEKMINDVDIDLQHTAYSKMIIVYKPIYRLG